MLKPEDIKYIHPVAVDTSRDEECELQFDEAIRSAAEHDRWPATVSRKRDGMPTEVIERVAQRYRDVGWSVVTDGGLRARGYRAVIVPKPDGAR